MIYTAARRDVISAKLRSDIEAIEKYISYGSATQVWR